MSIKKSHLQWPFEGVERQRDPRRVNAMGFGLGASASISATPRGPRSFYLVVASSEASLVMKYWAIGVPANLSPIRRANSMTELRGR